MTTILLDADMTGFFRDRLVAAMSRRDVRVSEATEFYLVHLLTDHARRPAKDALDQPLVHRLAAAVEAPRTAERFRLFRELGDAALYVAGFFSDHFTRRGISRDYVVSMGHRGYGEAADLCDRTWGADGAFGEVYPELAESFESYARILDEVRETTALRTPQDIVRLYDRWRRTGSPLLAERLQEHGVFPQGDGGDTVLH